MSRVFKAGEVADALLTARNSRCPVHASALSVMPQSIEDAYAVQTTVMREIGPAGGYKTNWLDDGTQIVAPIAASNLFASGVEFAADDFVLAGVELEIAFRLDHELPDVADPDWALHIEQAFVALPALEILDSRLVDHTFQEFNLLLADNLSNAALVFGQPVADWCDANLSAPQHLLMAGDRSLSKGAGAVPGGSARTLLEGAVKMIGDHCGGLVPGQFITTGALSGAHWLEESATVDGTVDGFGSVTCSVIR